LKWKLLIPFLLFSFLGTTSLVCIGLNSQQELIKKEEIKELRWFYRLFLDKVSQKGKQALSMATILSDNPRIQALLAERNKKGLRAYTRPLYHQLAHEFGIRQFHFHIPPGISFLRVHSPDQQGEMIAYRKGVMDVLKGGKGIVGLEWGLTGLAIRGIVPIYSEDTLAGSIEIGYPFGRSFLEELKAFWGPDFTVFEKRGLDSCALLATTMKKENVFCLHSKTLKHPHDREQIWIAPSGYPNRSIFLGPLRDYQGEIVAAVEIDMDRLPIVQRLKRTRNLMVLVGVAGICISFALVWIVAVLFVRPIKEMVSNAQEIAEGKREQRIRPGPEDEIGVLAHALNTMLSSLQKRELQIKEYTKTLEKRVQERTQDLVSSEEKYRTLVDNLPLVVYRLLPDGTTEFINPYFTSKLGFSANEVVGNKRFWQQRIWGCDDPAIAENVLANLIEKKKGFRVQRVVKDKAGRRLTFIDHAIPVFENGDDLKWIEGIMVDITELKRLQEKALRTEEIRVLGEISARFAHEMRNPLATAGGFARRLRDSLKEDPYHQRLLNIIVEEVARLEKILKIILNSIEPFSLSISMVDIKGLVQEVLSGLQPLMSAKHITLKESISPLVDAFYGDGVLLKKAFDSLLKHAVVSMPDGEELMVSSQTEGDRLVFTMRHKANGMTQDDLDQFFYPHVTGTPESTILELPQSKIIIHRHGGKVDVLMEGEDIVLRVELPFIPVGMDKVPLGAASQEVPS